MANLSDPRVEISEATKESTTFYVTNAETSLMNALRRVIISEVPTMAIDLVQIEENTSALCDEMIAHRLGLIPLQCTPEVLEKKNYVKECNRCDEFTDRVCDFCGVEFRLNVENQTDTPLTVTTNHLISPLGKNERDIFPYMPDNGEGVPIVKLRKNQKLALRAIGRKGIGKEHSKWSPASCCVFMPEPSITVNYDIYKRFSEDDKKEWISSCPTRVYRYRQIDGNLDIENWACMYCNECVRIGDDMMEKYNMDRTQKLVRISEVPGRHKMTVESAGSLESRDIVLAGIKRLASKVSELKLAVRNVNVGNDDKRMTM